MDPDPNPNRRTIRVVMLPWLAHGHLSPFLELAKVLSKRNFYIYVCSTPVNLAPIKGNLYRKKYSSLGIELVDLNLPPSPELPPCRQTTNGLPPRLMSTLKTAFDMAKPEFHRVLDSIKPDLLIYDFLQPWAPEVASESGIPAVLFLSTGAAASSYFFHLELNPSSEFPSPAIYIRGYEKAKLDHVTKSVANGITDPERASKCWERSTNIVLIKTSRALEGKYIDYLSILRNKRMIPVGPLIQDPVLEVEDGNKPEIIRWLDEKPPRSTLFASFGSEYFLSSDEIKEIAHGLELSAVNFIWVVRFPAGEKSRVEEALPEGFMERIKDRGRVVEGWAPQARILGHGSVGGFLSHCGWSSLMEGIAFGVPVVGLPMHLDQPLNCRMVEEAGVGVEVRRDGGGRVERGEVGRVVREVVARKSGEAIRMRVLEELRVEMRTKGEAEMEAAVEELLKLCCGKYSSVL
ncbi:UDP-glucosyltransferase 29-like [Diospyros lotus]|uniref:UDP-glucosyltransferase 29-like n=1 Tax=Diospyros lotus TaxID=55363 RepID=UPI002252419A|nr:UDP-glucosyltransferase 29-like [Diospyros lotus]